MRFRSLTTVWCQIKSKSRFLHQSARSFSVYANYDHNSQFYDNCRTPVGVGVIEWCIRSILNSKQSDTSPNAETFVKVLDAGCGTGNYLQTFAQKSELPANLVEFYGLDLNQKMLDCAKNKCKDMQNVNLFQGSVLTLTQTFPHNYFDCIMVNQTLHHLDTVETRYIHFFYIYACICMHVNCNVCKLYLFEIVLHRAQNFFNTRKALCEIHKVLKHGGAISINYSLPKQLSDGIWFYQMLPVASKQMSLKFPDSNWFTKQLDDIGYKPILPEFFDTNNINLHQNVAMDENTKENGKLINLRARGFGDSIIAKQQRKAPKQTKKYFETTIFDPFIKSHIYFDFEGPFKKHWRSCDSIWNLASLEEIEQCQTKLQAILNDDEQRKRLENNAFESLTQLGHSTTLVACK